MAVEIGERFLVIDKIGTTPISPLSEKYKVNGLPEWMEATVHSDGTQWSFSVRPNEQRQDPIKHPRIKPPDRSPFFASRDEALDGLRQNLRDYYLDPATQI